MLIIWQIHAIPEGPLNMYDSSNLLDRYCVSYYSRGEFPICDGPCTEPMHIEQSMSYCLRPTEESNLFVSPELQHTTNLNISFAELRQTNVTSGMLLSWSTAIEMAERYQIFLNIYSNLSAENGVVFQNCTPPWFGPFCRFAFDDSLNGFFTDTAYSAYPPRSDFTESQITCYIHLACQTSLSCLDWRQICDRKPDCFDGADDKDCWELEMNECADDEYRCVNDQCIPWEYYRDRSQQSECFDRTDELSDTQNFCSVNPEFVCEEHACRPGEQEFSCDNGECIYETSKCDNGRSSFLPNNLCSNATLCFLQVDDYLHNEWCELFCPEGDCLQNNCSMVYEFRQFPLLFGHVRLIVSNETSDSNAVHSPDYACYDTIVCPHLPRSTASFNDWTCHHLNDLGLQYIYDDEHGEFIQGIKHLFRRCLIINDNEQYNCSSSTLYQCSNSTKCISRHRLLNGVNDCPFGDDETNNQSCSLGDIRQRFKCRDEGSDRCYTSLTIENGREECQYDEDELTDHEAFTRTHISFSTICDGITHLLPLFIDGENETDETGCEPWQCINTYTRCDGIWSCKNGADEVGCSSSTCTARHHSCVFPNDTSKVSCLSLDRANDGIGDCVGGTDEQTEIPIVRTTTDTDVIFYRFRCRDHTTLLWEPDLCNNQTDCPLNDDEAFCQHFSNLTRSMCRYLENSLTDVEKFLCAVHHVIYRKRVILFKLNNVLSYPLSLVTNHTSIIPSTQTKSLSTAEDRNNDLPSNWNETCNRGVPISSLSHKSTSIVSCLCPPSYYGDKCQYQNQRVSFTLQIRLIADWRKIFVFRITLIDTKMNIESHEWIEYLPSRDCRTKYNLYLLYGTRPKNSSRIFSVRIDAFSEMALNYRASWTFCHCSSGWSGTRCDRKVKCECASDAICIADSICLCPPGRFSPQRYLSHSICHSQSCFNGGHCASLDARYNFAAGSSSVCICPEGYAGSRCEHRQQQTQIDISFHDKITIPPSLLVHFIAVHNDEDLESNRTTIAKKLQFDQSSLIIYTITSFNIAVAQILSDYYLIVIHEQTITAAHISTQVIPTDRC